MPQRWKACSNTMKYRLSLPPRPFFAAFITLFGGCSGEPQAIPIRGHLHFDDGKPVVQASIRFVPKAAKGRLATGFTDENGRFFLTTSRQGDGLFSGDYSIVVMNGTISKSERPPPGLSPAQEARWIQTRTLKNIGKLGHSVPTVYSDEKQSPLFFSFDGSNTNIKLTVKR